MSILKLGSVQSLQSGELVIENNALIDALPLWGLFIAILGVVLISVECRYRLGKFRLSRCEQEKEAPVRTMVGATLGLFAFILAFTFAFASSRFDNRRQLLLDEANALGTTYCMQACFRSAAKKFAASCATT